MGRLTLSLTPPAATGGLNSSASTEMCLLVILVWVQQVDLNVYSIHVYAFAVFHECSLEKKKGL